MGVGSQASALLFEGVMVTVSLAGSRYLGYSRIERLYASAIPMLVSQGLGLCDP